MGRGGDEPDKAVRRVRALKLLVFRADVQQRSAAEPAVSQEVHVRRLPPAQVDIRGRQPVSILSFGYSLPFLFHIFGYICDKKRFQAIRLRL